MKHTDFYSQLENIKKQEILELTAAVKAHGSKVTFQFDMEPDDNAPILIFNPEGPIEVIVKTVTVEDDRLRVFGNDKNDYYADEQEEFSIEDALPGQLSFIIDAIPEKEPTGFDIDSVEFIDLGLQSGLLLATENVKDEDGNDALLSFDEAVEKYGKYMLTKEQWAEVFEHCSYKWDEERKGLLLTGPNGNTVFLPAAGYRGSAGVGDVGSYGYYWSSTPYSNGVNDAYDVYFYSGNMNPQGSNYRYNGFSVRLARTSAEHLQ